MSITEGTLVSVSNVSKSSNIDFAIAREEVAEFPGVACVKLSSNLCLDEGKGKMLSCIKEENIEKVVVAACSPELKGHVFQQVLESAGLNSNHISVANIREQCSWIHEGDVTAKAVELIKMALNRARLLQPVKKEEIPVNTGVLVIGGGFSAMDSAIRFSRLGLQATLLVKESALGERAREVEDLYRLDTNSMIRTIGGGENIEILTSAEVIGMKGKIGDYIVRIRNGTEEISRNFGAIVVATDSETELVDHELQTRLGVTFVTQEKLAHMLRSPGMRRKPEIVGFVFDFFDENSRFNTLATLSNA